MGRIKRRDKMGGYLKYRTRILCEASFQIQGLAELIKSNEKSGKKDYKNRGRLTDLLLLKRETMQK